LNINALKFTSSDKEVLSITTEGKILALKKGQVTVKIEISEDPSKFVECKVNIVEQKVQVPLPVSVNFVDLNGDITLKTEQNFNFSAFVKYDDGNTDKNITWSTSDSTLAIISAKGILTALKKGTLSVIARSTVNPEIKVSVLVNVEEPVIVENPPVSTGSSGGGGSSSPQVNTPTVNLSILKKEKIVYNNNTLGANNVYIFNGDGSNLNKLTFPYTTVEQVTLSTSENNILFVADKNVRTANTDGNRIVHIRTAFDSSDGGIMSLPIFSPDGLHILYTRYVGTAINIFSSAFHGADYNKLTANDVSKEAVFTSDSTKVIYIESDVKLEMFNLDGTNKTLIYSDTNEIHSPLASPDGNKIAFIRKDDATTNNIYTVNVDGTGLFKVTKNALGSNVNINKIIKWSKDSLEIV
jgi:dipeptidyl aminopeptidase/acylaminoacyl peptidase